MRRDDECLYKVVKIGGIQYIAFNVEMTEFPNGLDKRYEKSRGSKNDFQGFFQANRLSKNLMGQGRLQAYT